MEYSGIEKIDEQHEVLVRTIQKTRAWVNSPQEFSAMLTLLVTAREYAEKHFAFEEELMLKHDYFDFKNHKNVHDDFLEVIDAAIETASETSTVSVKTLEFLEFWVLHHIEIEAELFRLELKDKI